MKFYDITNINAVISDEYEIGSFKIREVNQLDVMKANNKLNNTYSAHVSGKTCDVVAGELTSNLEKHYQLNLVIKTHLHLNVRMKGDLTEQETEEKYFDQLNI